MKAVAFGIVTFCVGITCAMIAGHGDFQSDFMLPAIFVATIGGLLASTMAI